MGRFSYQNMVKVDFEDRALAHLQVVINSKLRRGESFSFSWKDDAASGNGRTSVWMHPNAAVVFKFYGGRTPTLNRAWVEALAYTANSSEGLYLIPEPAAE